jgi:hypothetical protein
MRNSPFLTQEAGPLKKLVTLVGGTVLLVLGLMFSMVVLIGVVVVGLMVLGYLWWKTREIRRVMRQAQAPVDPHDGAVIEGEAVVVDESHAPDHQVLSSESREIR